MRRTPDEHGAGTRLSGQGQGTLGRDATPSARGDENVLRGPGDLAERQAPNVEQPLAGDAPNEHRIVPGGAPRLRGLELGDDGLRHEARAGLRREVEHPDLPARALQMKARRKSDRAARLGIRGFAVRAEMPAAELDESERASLGDGRGVTQPGEAQPRDDPAESVGGVRVEAPGARQKHDGVRELAELRSVAADRDLRPRADERFAQRRDERVVVPMIHE